VTSDARRYGQWRAGVNDTRTRRSHITLIWFAATQTWSVIVPHRLPLWARMVRKVSFKVRGTARSSPRKAAQRVWLEL
jgi:hypothetical protein